MDVATPNCYILEPSNTWLIEEPAMARSVIAAQLYTVREFARTPSDIARTLARVRAIGYEAVQTSGLGPIEPRELRRIADGEGLTICATHVPFERVRDETDAIVEEHATLNCRHVAVPLMPQEYRTGADGFVRFARDAEAAGRKLASAGLTLSYHNHRFEFQRYDGSPGLGILFSNCDPRYVKAELDTYWVQAGGADPVAWIDRLHNRIALLHLKDMTVIDDQATFAEVGEGNLNWPEILKAARAAGVEWYIVEQDVCRRDPFESLQVSLRNLRSMGLH